MDLWQFFSELSGYVYIAFSLFWTVVAVMFHERLKVPLPAAIALGFVMQVVGFAIMLLIGLVFKAKQAPAGFAPQYQNDPFGGGSQASYQDPFGGYQTSFAPPEREKIKLSGGRIVIMALSAVGIVLLGIAAFLPWFYSSTAGPEVSIGVISSGIEIWLLLTLLAVIAGVLLSIKGWSLLSPLLIGYFSSWWAALALASMTNRFAFVSGMSAIYQLPNLITYEDGGRTSIISQRIGEAWLLVLPAGALLLTAALLIAYNYAVSSKAKSADFF